MTAEAAEIARVSYQPPRVPLLPVMTLAALVYFPASPAPFEGHAAASGPNPFVDYERRYTAEDGVAFTYKALDESGWRTVRRILALLFLMVMAFAYQVDASPYPILPSGCRPFGPCPLAIPGEPLTINLLYTRGFRLRVLLDLVHRGAGLSRHRNPPRLHDPRWHRHILGRELCPGLA